MKYFDTSANELQYYIASQELDVTDLIIIEQKTFSGYGFDIKLSVLGTSHSAHITYQNKTITEVFACKKPFQSDICQTIENPLSLDNDFQFETSDFATKTSFRKIPFHMDEIIKRVANTTGLVTLFPNKVGDLDKKSVTWVEVRFQLSYIEIRSMHTYPDEGAIVLTKSIIQVKNK